MTYRKFAKLVTENFAFLIEKGFKQSSSDYITEKTIIFEKNDLSIVVNCYIGINENYKKMASVDVVIEYKMDNHQVPAFGVIEFGKIRNNIRLCDKLFGYEKVKNLIGSLANKDIAEQIKIYGEFLKENIMNLSLLLTKRGLLFLH